MGIVSLKEILFVDSTGLQWTPEELESFELNRVKEERARIAQQELVEQANMDSFDPLSVVQVASVALRNHFAPADLLLLRAGPTAHVSSLRRTEACAVQAAHILYGQTPEFPEESWSPQRREAAVTE
jgi:hypothetical protein